MTKRRLTVLLATATAFAPIASACAQTSASTAPRQVQVRAEALPLVREIDERFQSFQIGMSHLTGGQTWRSYERGPNDPPAPPVATPEDRSGLYEARQPANLASPRLRTLAAALGPFYVRYGGTTSNSVYFHDSDAPAPAAIPEGYTVILTRENWKRAHDFAKAVDAKVVTGFTVSPGVRDAAGAWTPKMAEPWVAFTRSIGSEIYAAELYNEPNVTSVGHLPKGFGPAEYARDFAAFSAFARRAAPNMKLAGPGTALLGVRAPTMESAAAEPFMAAEPKPKFDIVSYHFYGAVADRCAPPNSPMGISSDRALSEEWLARQDKVLAEHKVLRDRYAPGARIWNTETGAAACGGPSWQPTFIDSFRFLDQNGRLAKQGLDAIFTHALISGSNGVIDEKTFTPRPNYWAALMWRRLMGTRVLDAGPITPGLHVYAHCQRGVRGGVTLMAINLDKTPASIGVSFRAEVYALTAPELLSPTVMLNGRPLALQKGDKLPKISPVRVKKGAVAVAPTSISFIALPQARNPACAA